jgi:two-component system aerobic respiration control protein ArcA
MLHFRENPSRIQSRSKPLKKMTGRELKLHDRTVDVTIRRIHKHFESALKYTGIIATIYGGGYRFYGDLQTQCPPQNHRSLASWIKIIISPHPMG